MQKNIIRKDVCEIIKKWYDEHKNHEFSPMSRSMIISRYLYNNKNLLNDVQLSQEHVKAVNEVLWDMVIARILTPGEYGTSEKEEGYYVTDLNRLVSDYKIY